MTDLAAALAASAEKVNARLDALLAPVDGDEGRVIEAMRYGTLQGGKRLRPFLVLQAAGLFGVPEARALDVGCALEMIHSYSLVHDDLPAMDDDDLRRGQPTCHRKFDEATAILAGDGLQARAFEVLAGDTVHPNPLVRCQLVAALAEAAGAPGMVGGQMVDLMAEHRDPATIDIPHITRLQQLKTGRLFEYACVAGAILGEAPEADRQAMIAYARDMGLAFQIADDLLDVEGDEATVGKGVGKDAAAGKATFVSLLGIEEARREADRLAEQAVGQLAAYDARADLLRAVARYMVTRQS
ncbi:polyprenyl synthetase family protein [Roseospirillum parvum]|uniref:Farnesyl diphosphate synthase n=1 Tax=Roseospirillum parvum TaxID=83401 RepID=A0A1G8BQ68_9PROT|nr:farnesyl diphosphate synthase [Roseospirillum parvum]SDH34780.1 farnesyl diphosphate synthase [Roseospirillum parvum]